MARESIRILAVNPGGRYVGLAVFCDADLRDWRVSSLSGANPREKERALSEMVSRIIRTHGTDTLAIKALHPARCSPHLISFARKIKKMAEEKGLRIFELSIDELKDNLNPGGKSNKRLLMEEVAARYPFLYPELEREKKNKNQYLVRMFEAVALGAVCLSEMDSGPQKVVRKEKPIHA
jgi:hypothetical protein